jgi:hypothetical protein
LEPSTIITMLSGALAVLSSAIAFLYRGQISDLKAGHAREVAILEKENSELRQRNDKLFEIAVNSHGALRSGNDALETVTRLITRDRGQPSP